MAEEMQARRVTTATFGELRVEIDRPQDFNISSTIIVLDPENEEELHALIDATGGPLAWESVSSVARTIWHRDRKEQGISVHMNLPPLARTPEEDPIAVRIAERQNAAKADAREWLRGELEKNADLDPAEIPRVTDTLLARGARPGQKITQQMVEDALVPVSF